MDGEIGLEYYVGCFGRLNCNKRGGEVAPHKAVLLMAVMDEVRCGRITNGFVPLSDQMERAFLHAWHRYVGVSPLFNPVFATPFFHMEFEPFWDLMRKYPWEERKEYSLPALRANFYGAKIPDDLYAMMADEASRCLLQHALLDNYLPNGKQSPYPVFPYRGRGAIREEPDEDVAAEPQGRCA